MFEMTGFWTQEHEEQLLDLWEDKPQLYNITSQAYANRDSKLRAIKFIVESLGTSETAVKTKIETLRTQYSRYLKAKPSGSDGYMTPRQSWILQKMTFLEIHMRKRPSKSNLPSLLFLHLANAITKHRKIHLK